MTLRAADIHHALAGSWPAVLEQLGVDEEFLRNRHGPCPACGGKDRFRFDDRDGRGTFFCNSCGAGDGFRLLELVHNWDFCEARRRVIEAAGLNGGRQEMPRPKAKASARPEPAKPPERVLLLLGARQPLTAVADVWAYLRSRFLWPLPAGCPLRAHPALKYWIRDDKPKLLGRFPALIAEVVDVAGELVTVHATWVPGGRKLAPHEPRKLLSELAGRRGCAVRLVPFAGETLGVAEGIETALAAQAIHGVPVWAALNKSLLAKFEPPAGVRRLVVFADRDEAGLSAAARLMERLQGRVEVALEVPSAPAKDWADTLAAKRRRV